MALVLLDRAKETTTVVGTGTATLLGAVTSYQSLAGVGNGNTTYYCIVDQAGANWEVGIGTYTASGTTLARTTVLASSNAGALVVFTTGVKDVFVTYPSEKGVWYDASGNVLFTGTTTAANLAYTGTLTGGTGVIAIGTNQIYKDASGNVGIGTTSPSKTLDVNGTIGYTSQNVTTQTNYFNIGAAGSIGNATGSKMTFRRNYDNIELVTIDGSGNVTLQENISVGGAAPTTVGTGITFPATQAASSNANTLDDYEEGTWTPTYVNFTITSGTSEARYTKVGRVITANIWINATSVTCLANATFTLPIAAVSYSAGSAVSGNVVSGIRIAASTTGTVLVAITATTNLALTVTYQLAS